MTTVYLGIDGGNSKTAAVVCLASGEVIGAGRSGCGDIYGVPEPAAVGAVLAAVDDALSACGAQRSQVKSAAFRLAGVDWPEDAQFWADALAAEWPGLTRSIRNDGYAAIRSGELSGIGVAVNAGTAAAIAACGPGGALWDMGWWGQHAMGATGLVKEALKAVYLAELGAAPQTALGPALLEFYRLPSVTELNRWFTRREDPAGPADRTRAARVVAAAARSGDPVASAIVTEQGCRMAFYAEIAARQVGLCGRDTRIPVVMAGSVLMAPASPVAEALAARLRETMPAADPRPALVPPVGGAALDALAEGQVALSDDVLSRLAATMPPPPFLET